MSERPPPVRFRRAPGDGSVEYLAGHYRDFAYAPHSHDRYMLGLITAGAIEIAEPGRRVCAERGQIVLYNVDTVHWGKAADTTGWSILATYVTPERINEAARDIGLVRRGSIGFRAIADTDRRLGARIQALHTPGTLADELARDAVLHEVFATALPRHASLPVPKPRPPSEHRATTLAAELLDAACADGISLAALAEACGLSRHWLLKAFKARYGMPPHAYLTDRRVRQATRLLREGRPPAMVALDCGFADQSHLTRTFKRLTGLTPSRFQAA